MSTWLKLLAQGGRALLDAACSLLLWSLWLALALLLVAQLYIVSARELALPDFLLRQIEARLVESGLRATFGRTSFDPTGRILIENARVSLPAFADPVLTARAVYLQLNPLALAVGRFDPSEVRLMGAVLAIPAPLSLSGRAEDIVRDLDATVEPSTRSIALRQFTARVAGIVVSAEGVLPLPRATDRPAAAGLADFLAHRFPELGRRASALSAEVARFEGPSLNLDFVPSESGALGVNVTVLARSVRLAELQSARLTNVRAATRLLFFGDSPPSHVEFSADRIEAGAGAAARGVHATVFGRVRPDASGYDLREVALTADTVEANGLTAQAVAARLFPRPLPWLEGTIVTRFLREPLAIRGEADTGNGSATLRFEGGISPDILEVISGRVGVNVRRFYEFDSLTVERGEVRFGPGWDFEKLTARVRVPRMNSYGVIMEAGRAAVELDRHRFYSPDAYARVGENFAQGTYEHDFRTNRYRFLLDGRLRPLAISPWFRPWWSDFFRQIEFADAPPDASVDVRGVWGDGGQSGIFVFADVGRSVLRGTEFDRLRTRLFIRPAFFDGFEVLAIRGATRASGRFTLTSQPDTNVWQSLDLALVSNLALNFGPQLLGPTVNGILAPFELSEPPEVTLRGTLAGPAASANARSRLRVEARTTGGFRYQKFPLEDVSFVATLDGTEILLDDLYGTFGGGAASGKARIWGEPPRRRMGFDVALQDATLGQVASTLQGYFAAQQGLPPPAPGKFVQEKAGVRLDLAMSAEGNYNDPHSFRGSGNAALRGGELGGVPLLGALSELLRFTSLRFTDARSNFKIDGPKVLFQQVELRGANSAIDASGEYSLERRTLDFNARVFPFQESEGLIRSVVGAVLTPLSAALEVKLTGSLEKPQWVFVRGPTNFLRALGEGAEGPTTPSAEDPNAPITVPIPPSVPKPP